MTVTHNITVYIVCKHVIWTVLLCRHPGRALVFVNAVSALRRVAALLKLLGLPAYALHAQQQQRQRLKALDHFKNKNNTVLVATDVAARGLDVKDIRWENNMAYSCVVKSGMCIDHNWFVYIPAVRHGVWVHAS